MIVYRVGHQPQLHCCGNLLQSQKIKPITEPLRVQRFVTGATNKIIYNNPNPIIHVLANLFPKQTVGF